MSDREFLDIRRKALEEAFFAEHNEKLLTKLREAAAKDACKKAITEVTGITDDEVLEKMITAGLCSETVAALYLVPLVEVAWADGEIQSKERQAILKAAEEHGMAGGSIAHQLLEGWLDRPLDPQLLDTWKSFVEAMASAVDADSFATLKEGILVRARGVAEAAGGFLGVAKISAKELAMLQQLEQAFSG